MALRRITFDGATVSSKDNADVNYHLFNLLPAGIIKGLGNNVSVSAGNNTITFGSGYIQIYGRRIYMEANTQVAVTLDGTKNGYVIVDLNLASNELSLEKLEVSSGWPGLIHNNLSTTVGRYQFPIARYKKTATSLTLDVAYINSRPLIRTINELVDSRNEAVYDWVQDNYNCFVLTPLDPEAAIMAYDIGNLSIDITTCLVHIRLGRKAVFTISGNHLEASSVQTLSYFYYGSTHYLTIEFKLGFLALYSSHSEHKVTAVEVFR